MMMMMMMMMMMIMLMEMMVMVMTEMIIVMATRVMMAMMVKTTCAGNKEQSNKSRPAPPHLSSEKEAHTCSALADSSGASEFIAMFST